MANILGISLGTRLIGMAVVYDGELYDFRIRTFYGPWTEKKRRSIVGTIRNTVQRYGVASLSVKSPKPAYCSQSINDLLSDVRQLSDELGMTVKVCTISALKERCNGTLGGNKQALIQTMVDKYPQYKQLAELYIKERDNRSAYYTKLFEAIACTELV